MTPSINQTLSFDQAPYVDQKLHGQTDVLIVCALAKEYNAVVSVTDGLADGTWEEVRCFNRDIASFASFTATDGQSFSVCVTFCAEMGRDYTLLHASDFVSFYRPKLIGMTGICAGWRGKVNLGDVIFADRVFAYDYGKNTLDKTGKPYFQPDLKTFEPRRSWLQRLGIFTAPSGEWKRLRPTLPLEWQEEWVLRSLAEGKEPSVDTDREARCPDWPRVLDRLLKKLYVSLEGTLLELTEAGGRFINERRFRDSRQPDPPDEYKVHVAPIATGTKVEEVPDIFDTIATMERKVLGVDMEASAIGLLADKHQVPFIVAKVVVDYADPFKDDRYHHFAARASAECFLHLIRSSCDLLKS